MRKEHEIRNEMNELDIALRARSDPVFRAILIDRRKTLEWVLGE